MRAKITIEELKSDITNGLTIHEIAAKHSCVPDTIYKRCTRAHLVYPVRAKHHRTRQQSFNTRFFAHIDSETKAYIVGFIAADGGRDRNWGLKIGLHPKDADILHKISQALECNQGPRMVENNTRIRLALYDIDMVHDLERCGITERKTFTLPFAKGIPVRFLRHYLRGVFDGDGSLGRQARLVTGSTDFNTGFLNWYERKYGRTPWHRQEGDKYRLVFNRVDAPFIRWMYRNATIVLNRKYELFLRNWNKL